MATRAYLRYAIGGITGDRLRLKATAAGSTTSLVDVLNLATENNELVGRFGWVASGTAANLYQTVRITANTKSATSITFVPALPQSTATNDVIELYNSNDTGITPEDIHDAINRVIESVSNAGVTEVIATSSTFDADSPALTIDPSWRRLIGVDWQDTDGLWHEVDPADLYVDTSARTARIDNIVRWMADTQLVRLRGYTSSASLSADTDSTVVDAEWIINEASSQLLLANAEKARDPAAARATAQYLRSIADSRRPKVLRPVRSRSWVLG